MSKSNKFAFIRDVSQNRDSEALPEPPENQETPTPAPEAVMPDPLPKVQARSRKGEPAASPDPVPVKKMGRPPGKRSNPDYEQITAYIRRDTHLAVKVALLQEGQGREFSELIQDLLIEYLRTQKSKNSNT